MCGRMNVIDDPLCQIVSETLGISFKTKTNEDLCPSQPIAAVMSVNQQYQQLSANWGIQPDWSKRLLINAQAETVAQKPTFTYAFTHNRCVVPCSGWYEWRVEGSKKVKYLFSHSDNQPLYMAAIGYQQTPNNNELVTLTTSPNEKCAMYHKRMPVFVLPENIEQWFHATPQQVYPLMHSVESDMITVQRAS